MLPRCPCCLTSDCASPPFKIHWAFQWSLFCQQLPGFELRCWAVVFVCVSRQLPPRIMSDSGSTAAIIIVVVLLVIFFLWGFYLSVKVVREKVCRTLARATMPQRATSSSQEAMVIERLGKWRSTLQAGLHFIVPFLGKLVCHLSASTRTHFCECVQIGHEPTASGTTSAMPAAICNLSRKPTRRQFHCKMKVGRLTALLYRRHFVAQTFPRNILTQS